MSILLSRYLSCEIRKRGVSDIEGLTGYEYQIVTVDDDVDIESFGDLKRDINGNTDYTVFILIDVLLSNIL